MESGLDVDLQSLNNNANLLIELAGALGAGRPDYELSRRACSPATPVEVSDELSAFAAFGADQYQDLVALLAALSTRLQGSSDAYATADADATSQFLRQSRYIPPAPR